MSVTDGDGLRGRGRALWDEITEGYALDATQRAILEEACRCAERLDGLDRIIAGKGVLELLHARHMDEDGACISLTVDGVMSEARQQQTVFKQLLAALRLPDVKTGSRPQQRGGGRGSYAPSGAAGGKVSSIDRARARSAG